MKIETFTLRSNDTGGDKAYLARFGEDADRLAGLFPVSGQTNTACHLILNQIKP